MAYTVVSQTFYKDKLVQYANLVSTGSNFNNAYADLESYISHISTISGYTAYMQDIDTLSVHKMTQFIDDEPNADSANGFYKGNFMITVTFKRHELPTNN